jgi:3-phenylpropionate/trans-cinnamate dioxygenase ferredoxin component
MGEFVDAAGVDDLKDDEMRAVSIAGKKVLVAKAGGRFYATDNACPHLKGSLADGTLEGSVVTCPRHGSRFDLTDGHVVRWTGWSGVKLSLAKALKSPRSLKTYEVKIEKGRVLVLND